MNKDFSCFVTIPRYILNIFRRNLKFLTKFSNSMFLAMFNLIVLLILLIIK